MVCTEAKRTANRRNATKSTGPRTPEGKANSSRNALKHGFCATGSSLTPLEDRAAYESFTQRLIHSLRPVTAMEEDLANRVADLSWRLRRIPDAESALLTRDTIHDLAQRSRPRPRDDREDDQEQRTPEQDQQQEPQPEPDDDREKDEAQPVPESPARLFAAAMSIPQNPYLTLQRYEQSLDRARFRALKELRQLQKDRRTHPEDEAEEAPAQNEPTPPIRPLTPSPEGEGRGEGEASDGQIAPRRNEPTIRVHPRPSAVPSPLPSRPLRAVAPSRLPHPELPNEPNPPSVSSVSSVAEQPSEPQIANQNSPIQRPPQLFHLKRSDLRPPHRKNHNTIPCAHSTRSSITSG